MKKPGEPAGNPYYQGYLAHRKDAAEKKSGFAPARESACPWPEGSTARGIWRAAYNDSALDLFEEKMPLRKPGGPKNPRV